MLPGLLRVLLPLGDAECWLGPVMPAACCLPVGLQEDVDRLKRLLRAEKEVTVEDEQRGGQQENLILELQRAVGGSDSVRADYQLYAGSPQWWPCTGQAATL